jgi:hypothetical protein
MRSELRRIERLTAVTQSDALRSLATQIDADAQRSTDAAKATLLVATLRELAGR